MKKLLFIAVAAVLLTLSTSPADGGSPYPYTTPTYQYDVERILLIGVPVNNYGLDYYFRVGSELQEERITKRVIERIQQEKPVQSQVVQESEPDFRLIRGGSELDARVLAIFKSSCIRCHKPGQSRPGVQLFTAEGKLFFLQDKQKERERRKAVYEAVESSMPKGQTLLPVSERQTISLWSKK